MRRMSRVVLEIYWDDAHEQDPKDYDWVAICQPFDMNSFDYYVEPGRMATQVLGTSTIHALDKEQHD